MPLLALVRHLPNKEREYEVKPADSWLPFLNLDNLYPSNYVPQFFSNIGKQVSQLGASFASVTGITKVQDVIKEKLALSEETSLTFSSDQLALIEKMAKATEEGTICFYKQETDNQAAYYIYLYQFENNEDKKKNNEEHYYCAALVEKELKEEEYYSLFAYLKQEDVPLQKILAQPDAYLMRSKDTTLDLSTVEKIRYTAKYQTVSEAPLDTLPNDLLNQQEQKEKLELLCDRSNAFLEHWKKKGFDQKSHPQNKKYKQHKEFVNKIKTQLRELEQTKQLILGGIDKIIHRGEQLESLEAKTAQLAENAAQFRKAAAELNKSWLASLWAFLQNLLSGIVRLTTVVATGAFTAGASFLWKNS